MGRHHPDRFRTGVYDPVSPLRGHAAIAVRMFQFGEYSENPGLVHTVNVDVSDFLFLIHTNYSGEEIPVTLEPEKRALLPDTDIFHNLFRTCPLPARQQEGLLHRTPDPAGYLPGLWVLVAAHS
jgi:hypothetical protein